MAFFDIFAGVQAWHWLALVCVFLAFEALGIGGFLMGMTAAAVIAACLNWLGFSWQAQFIGFGVWSVLLTWLYWYRFKRFNNARQDSHEINDRYASMMGKHGKVVEITAPGSVKAQFGDTLWVCLVDDVLAPGDMLEVTGRDGSKLTAKKAG